MWARWLADAVVLVHFAFVVFVVLGGWLVAYRRGLVWIHVPCAIWGFLIEVRGWICPLTYLENDLRRRAGQLGYPGGFIEHYLIPVLYPVGLTRDVQLVLAALVVVANVLAYAWVVVRWRREIPNPLRGRTDRRQEPTSVTPTGSGSTAQGRSSAALEKEAPRDRP